MSIVSNANNRFKVKHRDTNVQTGRPGPMRSFHRYNRIEGTPTIAILEYFGREWDWGYDLTTHRTLITASKSSTQAYILFVQDRRYCCIDSAKIHARRPSSLLYIETGNESEIMTLHWVERKQQREKVKHRNIDVLPIRPGPTKSFQPSKTNPAHSHAGIFDTEWGSVYAFTLDPTRTTSSKSSTGM